MQTATAATAITVATLGEADPGLADIARGQQDLQAGIGQDLGGGLPLLSKPYRRDELAETLRESLGHR